MEFAKTPTEASGCMVRGPPNSLGQNPISLTGFEVERSSRPICEIQLGSGQLDYRIPPGWAQVWPLDH